MERRVAIVAEIGILKAFGVILDDAFEEDKVIKMDCTAYSDRHVHCLSDSEG